MKPAALGRMLARDLTNRSRKGAAQLKPAAIPAGTARRRGANRSRKGAAQLKLLGVLVGGGGHFRLTAPERGRHN